MAETRVYAVSAGGRPGWSVCELFDDGALRHDPHPRPLPTRGRGERARCHNAASTLRWCQPAPLNLGAIAAGKQHERFRIARHSGLAGTGMHALGAIILRDGVDAVAL